MEPTELDADLPGDETFRPVKSGVVVQWMADGRGLMGSVDALPADAQAAQLHNVLRYFELQKLRRGEANLYAQSRYRH